MVSPEQARNMWKDPEYRRKQSLARKGKPSPIKGTHRKIGSRIKHSQGYWLIMNPGHPYVGRRVYVPEHRLVVEKIIGHYINPKKYHVHHINKIKTDNRPENLMLVTFKEHRRIHAGWKRINNKWWKPCSKCNKFLLFNKHNFYYRSNGEVVSRCKKCERIIACKRERKYRQLA